MTIKRLAVITAMLYILGCAQSTVQNQPSPTPEPVEPSVSDIQPKAESDEDFERNITMADLRPDLLSVVLGIYREMKFPESTEQYGVYFEQPLLMETEPELDGYSLAKVLITRDVQADTDPLHRKVSGELRVIDTEFREKYFAFNAEYVVGTGGTLVLSSAAVPVYGKYSNVRFFVVEAKKTPPLKYLKDADYDELFEMVSENAMTEEELKKIDSFGEYKIFAFDMVKDADSAELSIYTDASLGMAVTSFSHSGNTNGWKFAMAEGEFLFNSAPEFKMYGVIESGGAQRNGGSITSSF